MYSNKKLTVIQRMSISIWTLIFFQKNDSAYRIGRYFAHESMGAEEFVRSAKFTALQRFMFALICVSEEHPGFAFLIFASFIYVLLKHLF